MRKEEIIVLILCILSTWISPIEATINLKDSFDNTTIGEKTGGLFLPGKTGQGFLITSTEDTIKYPSNYLNSISVNIKFWLKLENNFSPGVLIIGIEPNLQIPIFYLELNSENSFTFHIYSGDTVTGWYHLSTESEISLGEWSKIEINWKNEIIHLLVNNETIVSRKAINLYDGRCILGIGNILSDKLKIDQVCNILIDELEVSKGRKMSFKQEEAIVLNKKKESPETFSLQKQKQIKETQEDKNIQMPLGRKISLAITDLGAQNISEVEATIVSEILLTELSNTEAFTILERSKMKEILKEHALQLSGITSDSKAIETGKLLNVENLIVGSVSKLKEMYYINVRVVDIAKGEVLIGETIEFNSIDSSLSDIIKVLAKRVVKKTISRFSK